jgi:hypothetical protein
MQQIDVIENIFLYTYSGMLFAIYESCTYIPRDVNLVIFFNIMFLHCGMLDFRDIR